MLNDTQKQAVATALRASQNATVVAALAIRDDVTLAAFCNSASNSNAWNDAMSGRDLFEATDITKFDNLTAGKRDAWRLMLSFAPIDMSRAKNRKAVNDSWGGAADAVTVLQACLRKATNVEIMITPDIAGNQATTNTVVGVKLNWTGAIALNEVSDALNRF